MTEIDLGKYQLHLAQARKRRVPEGSLIRKGSPHTRAIRALQERLSQLGYEISVDGRFGSETDKALREFQKDQGVISDGIVGRKTLNKLLDAEPEEGNPADAGIDAITAVVAPGMSQTSRRTSGLGETRARQRGGGRAAKSGDSDSSRSKSTSTDRKDKSSTSETKKGPHGGTIDPVTGREIATTTTGPIGSTKVPTPKTMTWERGGKAGEPKEPANQQFEEAHPRAEAGHPNGGQFVAKGDSGPLVTNTQTALNQADDAGLQEDGDFGPKTDKAVREFQRKEGLEVDGVVGLQTTAALRRKLKEKMQ